MIFPIPMYTGWNRITAVPCHADAANALVAHNVNRLGKRLFTEVEPGTPVACFLAKDAKEESEFVVNDMLRNKREPGTVAVFYRAHILARLIEEALRNKRIPYVVVGGFKFYSRKSKISSLIFGCW